MMNLVFHSFLLFSMYASRIINSYRILLGKIKRYMNNKKLTPFLKWPGGKQWLVKHYINIFPNKFNKYYEPFLGGGAAFFALHPSKAMLTDINKDLINLYICMRDNPEDLRRIMEQHQKQHSEQYYYYIRGKTFETNLERAGRFLYLNRTCFNGMYRVNKQGDFNVPIGTKNNCIYDVDTFDQYSELLKDKKIVHSDFGVIIERTKKGDLIFADPPYTVQKKQNNFIKYNEHLFTWRDQERLFDCLLHAKLRGVKIVLTNANCKEVRDMYQDGGFFLQEVSRNSSIAGEVSKRRNITELLITSYELSVDK